MNFKHVSFKGLYFYKYDSYSLTYKRKYINISYFYKQKNKYKGKKLILSDHSFIIISINFRHFYLKFHNFLNMIDLNTIDVN